MKIVKVVPWHVGQFMFVLFCYVIFIGSFLVARKSLFYIYFYCFYYIMF
jgi:hypothetical protein